MVNRILKAYSENNNKKKEKRTNRKKNCSTVSKPNVDNQLMQMIKQNKQFGTNVLNQNPTFSASAPSSQHGHGLVGQHFQGQDAGNQEPEAGHLAPLNSRLETSRFLSGGVFEETSVQTSPHQLGRAQGQDKEGDV